MIWIYAPSIPTQMINYKTLLDWTFFKLIHKSRNVFSFSFSIYHDRCIAISGIANRTCPHPATRIRFWAYFFINMNVW